MSFRMNKAGYNSVKNKMSQYPNINRKKPRMFFPRPLFFKLQQEVLKFSDICVCWSSPKTDQENFF